MTTQQVYAELRKAVVDYFAYESTSDEKRDAYAVITQHIRQPWWASEAARAEYELDANMAPVEFDDYFGSMGR